jgi:predicted HTH transcriptional regulator
MANVAPSIAAGHIHVMGQFTPSPANSSLIPTAIIGKKEIGLGPKLVYTQLLAYAAVREPATNNRLAADLAVSPRSIRNYISALKAVGLVEVQFHPGKPRSFTLAAAN